jgi:pseudouridine-5'-phosphate glycosidase
MIELHLSPEVELALNTGKAVVALESTIISHGMPFPQNLEVAQEVEATVRANGAVPATIAIVGGKVHVGLTAEELESFAKLSDVMKCSRRDLAFATAQGLNGATTVAATMIIAAQAGIAVFATGGIGGVHRKAESTFDISADLREFATTPVAVVSAGAKAILDLPKTMEYLETMGVPVVGFDTDFFPAFYYRNSGIKVPLRLNDAASFAKFLLERNKWGAKEGVLVANPIPTQHELDKDTIETAIGKALQEADHKHVSGKELTPFLLKNLNQITLGNSQIANKALVLNNAAVGARIAVEYAALLDRK